MCPSVHLERCAISASDLRAHSETPFIYRPEEVSRPILQGAGINAVVSRTVQLEGGADEVQDADLAEKTSNEDGGSVSSADTDTNKDQETVLDLIGFGATEVRSCTTLIFSTFTSKPDQTLDNINRFPLKK